MFLPVSNFYRRNSTSLYVRETGPRDAPAIVFLHGLGFTSTMWLPQLKHLAGFHCLAPDLPGSGNSISNNPFTLLDTSQRVVDMIQERVPTGRAHVVGLSMGGSVALSMMLNSSNVIDHLMVSGVLPGLNPVLANLSPLVKKQIIRRLSINQLASLMLYFFRIPQENRSLIAANLPTIKSDVITQLGEELTRFELPKEATVPTLITIGQKDIWFIRRAAREMKRTIRGSKEVMIPGAGHIWNLQIPALFSETLQKWVTDEPLPNMLTEIE